MAYLDELIKTQNEQIALQQTNNQRLLGINNNEAYARYFPTWEVTTPQYQVPIAWSLAQLGYRTNEVAYACIDLWMKTVSEPPIVIYDTEEEEIINDGKGVEEFINL